MQNRICKYAGCMKLIVFVVTLNSGPYRGASSSFSGELLAPDLSFLVGTRGL